MFVEYRHERIVMGTYRVIGEDPLPRFFEYYPYTGLNDFEENSTPVSYDSVVVENEYLRMRVIPSLGARLYDLYDKVNGAHVFHHNDIIRPAMIALRGAWISTGMEFNSLDRPHHTVDNFSPVDYEVERGRDGSVTVYIGNLNLLTNIYWLVGLTLRPGRQYLETHVKLYNNDLLKSRYYFWTNTAESVTDGSRIFIPGKRTQSGAFPIYEGVDVSWYRNCKYAVDAFIIDCEEDFFGYYDYSTERGLVQHANHFVVPGKKRFTWGTSEDGLFWTPILSDKGMPYIELQSGRFRTQGIVEFMEPHFYEEWSEWWYPIAKIGGISFANRDATIYVDVKADGRSHEASIGIYATRKIQGSRILIRDGDDVIEEAFDLSPMTPFTKVYALKGEKVEVEVRDGDGMEIVRWDCRDYRTKLDESALTAPAEMGVESTGGPVKGLEGLLADATLEDKRGERLLAELKYKRLLELDGNCTSAACALASLYCRQGRYDESIELLEGAVKGRPDHEGAHYYLGLCYLKTGRPLEAEMALWKARRSRKYFPTASYLLGLIKVMNKEYEEAERVVAEGLRCNGRDLKGLFLLSAILRRGGKAREALEFVENALGVSPLHYPSLCERMLCAKGTHGFGVAESEFKRVVLADAQKVLAVAMEYVVACLFEEAEAVLRMGIESGLDGPMIHYCLGFALEKLGRIGERDDAYRIGNSKGPDYAFPHRPDEESILRSAKDASGDPKPSYYLGNLLFHLKRFGEGVREWELAEERGMRHPILHRNLGYAYHHIYRSGERAMGRYEKAIELDPTNHRLYLEYGDVCSWLGLTKKEIGALESADERIKRDSILALLSSAYVGAGRNAEALEILAENEFTPAEGHYGNWETYVEAHVRRGVSGMIEKEWGKAMDDFEASLRYPPNLGVGAPFRPHRHEVMQRYWIGECHISLGEGDRAKEVWEEMLGQKSITQHEAYYKGLGLKRLGRRKEAVDLFRGELRVAQQRETRFLKLRAKMPTEYFNFMNYDRELAKAYCGKMIAYLGLGRRKEALREYGKAQKICRDLGHYEWILRVGSTFSQT